MEYIRGINFSWNGDHSQKLQNSLPSKLTCCTVYINLAPLQITTAYFANSLLLCHIRAYNTFVNDTQVLKSKQHIHTRYPCSFSTYLYCSLLKVFRISDSRASGKRSNILLKYLVSICRNISWKKYHKSGWNLIKCGHNEIVNQGVPQNMKNRVVL